MPRDGNGIYTQPSGTAAVSLETASSSAFNTLISDIASEITASLPRNGSAAMTSALPMGGQKIENMANATARTGAPSAGQVADGGLDWYGNLSGTDTYTVASNGFSLSAYVNGFRVRARVVNANTGAATLNVNSIGAKDIVKQGDAALAAGDLPAGHIAVFEFDTNYDAFVLIDPPDLFSSLVDDTSPELGGELLTNAHRVRLSVGSSIASATSIAIPTDGNYFIVTGTTQIDDIQNVGQGVHFWLQFNGVLTLQHDATDLILPGGANITTAVGDVAEFVQYTGSGRFRCVNYHRASGLPVVNPSVPFSESYTSPQQTITTGGQLVLAHGLAATPSLVTVRIKCTTAEEGYAIDDEVFVPVGKHGGGSRGVSIVPDGTNLTIRYSDNANVFEALNKSDGSLGVLTNANWEMIVRAFA